VIAVEEYLELWLGFLACLILTVIYILYALLATPSGGQPFGEFLGIMGMMLMLVTESVYSLRKRVLWLQWLGSLRIWLSFHIFTGIVGPFLVLLHSAFAVGGLAGFALVMTGIVVLSGFVGRYIYTAVPHTRAGIEISRDELAARAAALQRQLDAWAARRPIVAKALAARAPEPVGTNDWLLVFVRTWQELEYNQRVRAAFREIERTERVRLDELRELLTRRRELEGQIASLDWVHRLMGIWRSVHVPLGAALFTAVFIHVATALYFKGIGF
jgi:hypothetical protein